MISEVSAEPVDHEKTPATSLPEVFALPVSSGQKRLWFLEQFQPDNPLYNVPIALRVEGPLDAAALEHAVNQVIQRHETLRTCFDTQSGEPVQIIAPSLSWKLPVVDLASHPPIDRDAEAMRLAGVEAQRPFDIKQLPLFRAKLLRFSPNEHVLVLIWHHIICDGWSLGVFFKELVAFYEGHSTGRTVELPELRIQYADFAVWQRERLKTVDKQLAWWKKQLGGSLPVLELPADRPRPAVQTYSGAVERLALPVELRDALNRVGRREEATLFMTLLAAFQTLLHRYTGLEDILVGSPIAGRNLTETEELIGCFINTLVLRGDLSANPTFRELLGRVREVAVAAYANEDVPFERLVEELQPGRDLSHSPLFQVMFALERAPFEDLRWPGLKLTPVGVDSGTAKFDLTLYMTESAEGLTARMEYNTDLFDGNTIQRMLKHFRVLLEGVVADPDKHLSDLPLLTEAERHQVLIEWNETRSELPRELTIHELFERQAAETPDAVALVFGGQQLTYRDLDGAANRLARHLQKLGVGPDALVGLCVERSPVMVVGLLGVLKAGGAYLPLDPAYPRERLAFMLEDSGASVLLTQKKLLASLPKHKVRKICHDSEWRLISRESAERPSVGALPEHLAYVLYTSGSTGKPKGVQIPHRAVVNFLNSMRRRPGLTREDVLLAVTTLSFDISGLELLLPLTVGARVMLASREEAADGAQLAARIAQGGVTVMQATPSTWRMLFDSGWQGSNSLRVFCGGEALSSDLANRLLERCAELWNLYGPTETTIWSTVAKVEPGADSIVVGGPIDNTQTYILDNHLQPLPVGVPGELFIGGTGLARGYLKRPELSAEKFIRHPFSADADARLYRTGDCARWRGDGNIELLGRLDHQVKLRGFRIELGEIESVLQQAPGVREAVVIVREDRPGDPRLAAYLTTFRQTSVSINELRTFLHERLPDYMLPSAFVMLDTLPLTPNGKVDRRALPAPESRESNLKTTFVDPDAGVEQAIAAIWREVLSVAKPGANDNFFDLGGHSLHVVRIQTRLREQLGIDIPVVRLFQYPTIRSLARSLSEGKTEAPFARRIHERTQRQRAAGARHRQFGARANLPSTAGGPGGLNT
ncbi:MAG TPA: amino acid adenylation domain-containing protein [Verrucomicrobiae bacterium]|nr:amino acid adenylation domain-containing protein [Verrucomicrobiae bacterium]